MQACELFLTHKVAGPLALGPGAPQSQPAGLRPNGEAAGVTSTARGKHRCPPGPEMPAEQHTQHSPGSAFSRCAFMDAPPLGHRGLFLPPSRGQPDPFLLPPPPPRPASGHAWKWGRGEGSRPAGKASRQAVSRLGRRRAQGKRGSPPAVFLSWGLRGGAEGHAGGSARLACLLTARPPGPIRCSSPARALSCRKHRG